MPTCVLINNSPQPGRAHLAKLGGGGMSLLGLLSRLPARGWAPRVVVPAEGQFTDAARRLGAPVTVYPFEPLAFARPWASWKTVRQWLALFRASRPQIIHANGFDLSRSFALAASLMGIPYITHVRFPVDEAGARWTLRGLPKPAAFIFNSQAMHDALWPMLSRLAPQTRPYVVHNAVDTTAFTPAPWPEGPALRIGMIANFAPFKRHEDFLRMAAEMLKVRQDVEFWIVGQDTQGTGREAVLKSLAEQLGLAEHVRFLGHRHDIADILRQLHLVVVPSQFEPFGRVVIEAMASGRPVIGSRDGGIPEIIEEGITGHLLPVGDFAAFARAALSLVADRDRWQAMSVAAVRAVEQRFSLDAHVTRITDIYQEVATPRRGMTG